MNIKTKEILVLQLTEEEIKILEIADDILLTVQALLCGELNKKDIVALETGEILGYKEVKTTRGVISDFTENTMWEFEENDE